MKSPLKENWKIKIVAILFGFFMWIYVMAELDPVIIKDFEHIPVNITNMQEIKESDLTPSIDEKSEVSISLRGRRSTLKDITENSVRIDGYIKKPKAGENIIQTYVYIPGDIEYTLNPENPEMNLEKNMGKKITLELSTQGIANKNIHLKELKISPKETYVEGPKSLMEKLDKLAVKVDLSDKQEDFSRRVRVVPVDKKGVEIQGIILQDKYAYISVGIEESKTVPVKITFKQENKDLKLKKYSLLDEKISIRGKSKDIKNITEIYTEDVNLDTLSDSGEVQLKFKIPQNVYTEQKDTKLKYEIEKLITKEILFPKNRITIRGTQQNLDISKNTIPENIRVRLILTQDNANKFDEKDVVVYGEMQEQDGKPAEIVLKVEVPYPVERVEISPKTLNGIG